jgi:hypothetical protein
MEDIERAMTLLIRVTDKARIVLVETIFSRDKCLVFSIRIRYFELELFFYKSTGSIFLSFYISIENQVIRYIEL